MVKNLKRTGPFNSENLSLVPVAARSFLENQSSLPRLPVPPLKDTLDRYLASVRPLLTPIEFQRTKEIVEKFGQPGQIGEKLTQKLRDRAKERDNWLAEWWLNCAYMEFRYPVVVHSSPSIIFPKSNFSGLDGQLEYAALATTGSLQFFEKIITKKLEVDSFGGRPMCMIQYTKLFGGCRIPKPKRDIFYEPKFGNPPAKHIIVICNNQIFALDVIINGRFISPNELLQQLKRIVESCPQPVESIGILSSNDRDSWAEAYARLSEDPGNAKNLDIIKTALFALCLDRPGPKIPVDPNSEEYGDICRTSNSRILLHGGGSAYNSGNRWFDKTFQLIVGPDGLIGANYEHSAGEGPPVVAVIDHIYDYCLKHRVDKNTFVDMKSLPPVKPLLWQTSPATRKDIQQAISKINELVNELELTTKFFRPFGGKRVKSYKISPDAFFQLAMQLAYYRLYSRSPPTYESGATRQYLLGRTETIRSATIESDNFARAMDRPDYNDQEKRELMLKALSRHKEITLKAKSLTAISGLGWDRHLLGMKLVALEAGIEMPDLYKDAAYIKSAHILLSTSQVPSRFKVALFFGPTAPDCYGVCYNPNPDNYIYTCTSFKSCSSTDSALFADVLSKSLLDMEFLLSTKSKL